PRVDETRSAERVAAHRRAAGLQVAADLRQIRVLEVADRRAGAAAQVRVLFDRGRQLLAVDLRAEAEVGVAEVVRRLVHDVDVELVMAEVGNFPARSRKGGRVVVHVAGRERHAVVYVDAGQGAEGLEGLELPL